MTPLNEAGSASANVAPGEYAVTIASRLTSSIDVYIVGVDWTGTGTLGSAEKSVAWTPTAQLFYGSNCQYDSSGPPVADIAGFLRN